MGSHIIVNTKMSELTNLIASKKNLLKPASRPRAEASKSSGNVNNVSVGVPEDNEKNESKIDISADLEKELCLAVNRELHVSYCYLVMSGIFTRQGLKSFSGMCTRQEDFHRGVARELVQHVTGRGGHLRLADIAEAGAACSMVSCAEAVR